MLPPRGPLALAMANGVRLGDRPREITLAASYFLVATLLFLFGKAVALLSKL
jgi:hypothetical protein